MWNVLQSMLCTIELQKIAFNKQVLLYRYLCNPTSVFSEQVCGFLRASSFLHQYNWPPRYNWNIVESGVKHLQTNKQTNKQPSKTEKKNELNSDNFISTSFHLESPMWLVIRLTHDFGIGTSSVNEGSIHYSAFIAVLHFSHSMVCSNENNSCTLKWVWNSSWPAFEQ
jgi:hypothetical protein